MDKEIETYYEERFSMMASKGWKDLMEDIENMIIATDKLSNVHNTEMLFFKKGELSMMTWLKTLKDVSNEAYEGLKNEQ